LWLIFIAAVVLVLRNHWSGAATAWLMLIVLLPYLVPLCPIHLAGTIRLFVPFPDTYADATLPRILPGTLCIAPTFFPLHSSMLMTAATQHVVPLPSAR